MEDTIILYATPFHFNTIWLLAIRLAKHCPSISFLVIGTVASPPPSAAPNIAYLRLPIPPLLPHSDSGSDHHQKASEIVRTNNPNLQQLLLEISLKSNIRASIIDFFCNPAFDVFTAFNIPTFFCNTTGASALCCLLYWPTIHRTIPQNIADLSDFLDIPGCPMIHSSAFPDILHFRETDIYKEFLNVSINMAKSAGIIVNTFPALEFRAMEALRNGLCTRDAPPPPVYSFGPLIDEFSGGDAAGNECLRWLDLQPIRSVVFLCFGRDGVLSAQQLKEMAVGLENSGYRFLWVVRSPEEGIGLGLEGLLPEGFFERTKERGLVVKEWAPQRAVLSHDSVGGFVTHCGQSSLLEAVSCGVPMIGWPLYAEQKINRICMVEEIKVALPLEEAGDGIVTGGELEKRVRELMESERGREVRRRVGELKVSAVMGGGAGRVDLERFVEAVMGRS